MGLKSSHWSCLKACLKGYTFCFTTFWSDHLLEHNKAINEPQKMFKWAWKIEVSSASSKFRLCASLKTCDLQILGNAWKCLRGNRSNKRHFFSLKILNFVQSFVECKVSLADGTWVVTALRVRPVVVADSVQVVNALLRPQRRRVARPERVLRANNLRPPFAPPQDGLGPLGHGVEGLGRLLLQKVQATGFARVTRFFCRFSRWSRAVVVVAFLAVVRCFCCCCWIAVFFTRGGGCHWFGLAAATTFFGLDQVVGYVEVGQRKLYQCRQLLRDHPIRTRLLRTTKSIIINNIDAALDSWHREKFRTGSSSYW